MVRKVDWAVFSEEDPSSGRVCARVRQKSCKSWHPVFHVSLFKKYHRDEKDLHLWHEDPRLPPEYEL